MRIKVLKLKLLVAQAGYNKDEIAKAMGITPNRWSWFTNEETTEDRLLTMKMSELKLLAIAVNESEERLAVGYGLGNPNWFALQTA